MVIPSSSSDCGSWTWAIVLLLSNLFLSCSSAPPPSPEQNSQATGWKRTFGRFEQGALPEYFFYNELTGHSQWLDPGSVPYAYSNGTLYWINDQSKEVTTMPDKLRYVWVEYWSKSYQRSYYYDQNREHSTWTRPVDLGWRRIKTYDFLEYQSSKHATKEKAQNDYVKVEL